MQLCAYINRFGGQMNPSEPLPRTVANAYSPTGVIRPKQLNRNTTTISCLAARIYLCRLIPNFEHTLGSIVNMVNVLDDVMEYIPADPEGFDLFSMVSSDRWICLSSKLSIPQHIRGAIRSTRRNF